MPGTNPNQEMTEGVQEFYHGTTWAAAKQILKTGLKAHPWQFNDKSYVWCTIIHEQAVSYGISGTEGLDSTGEGYAVVSFMWDYDKTEPDPEHGEDWESDVYRRIQSNIPASAITNVEYYDESHNLVKTASDAKPTKENTRMFAGLPIVVEYDEGEVRTGTNDEGKEWERIMTAPYGYIKGTKGAGDKEGVDVYLGMNENAPFVYVIEQLKEDKTVDEYKVMLGCDTEDEATSLYLKHYPKSWKDERLGAVEQFPIEDFRATVEENRTSKTAASPTQIAPEIPEVSQQFPERDEDEDVLQRDEPATQPEQQETKSKPKPKGKSKLLQPKPKKPAVQTKNFKQWFGKSKVRDEDGKPLVVYHGTTHDFEAFDPDKTNAENYYGKGLYFTSSRYDVSENYATKTGPDITSRIEHRAEEIMSNWEDEDGTGNTPKWSSDPESEYQKLYNKAKEKAATEIAGHSQGMTLPVYLSIQNPVIVQQNGGTMFEFQMDDDDNESGNGLDLYHAMNRAATGYDSADVQKAWGDIIDNSGGSFNAWDFEKAVRNGEYSFEDNEGNQAQSSFIADVYREMGFDGIIQDAYSAFGTPARWGKPMEMEWGTKHYIIWDPTKVKSAIGNAGKFDPKNPAITAAFKSGLLKKGLAAPNFPNFDAWVKKQGGLKKLLADLGDGLRYFAEYADESVPNFESLTPAQQEKQVLRLAHDSLEYEYDKRVSIYRSIDFPLTVYRQISIAKGQTLKTTGAGVFWSWTEDKAEAHWGTRGDHVTLAADIASPSMVDWDMTLSVNLHPSIGDDEDECRLKDGAQIMLTGILKDPNVGWEDPSPEGPITITAASKLPKGYRVTIKKDKDGLYWGSIWENSQYRGACPIGHDYMDVAREAAIDWAWQMSGLPHPEPKTAAAQAIVLINLPSDAAKKIIELGNSTIPDDDLAGDGREKTPHITVRYGVEENAEKLGGALRDQPPFTATLGRLQVFQPSASSKGTCPIVALVQAPQLTALHGVVDKFLGNGPEDFEFAPHVTIAFVKPEVAERYRNSNAFEGISFQVDEVVLSSKDKKQTPVPLGIKTASAGELYHGTSLEAAEAIRVNGLWSQSKEVYATTDINDALYYGCLTGCGRVWNPNNHGTHFEGEFAVVVLDQIKSGLKNVEGDLWRGTGLVPPEAVIRVDVYDAADTEHGKKTASAGDADAYSRLYAMHNEIINMDARKAWFDSSKDENPIAVRRLYVQMLPKMVTIIKDFTALAKTKSGPGISDYLNERVKYSNGDMIYAEAEAAAGDYEEAANHLDRALSRIHTALESNAFEERIEYKANLYSPNRKAGAADPKWFAGSKVVDAQGNPLTVYHGTIHQFEKFKSGEEGIFFTANPDVASKYTGKDEGSNVHPVQLSVKRPLTISPSEYLNGQLENGQLLMDAGNGYDGLRITSDPELDDLWDGDTWVVFKPSQIRSVYKTAAESKYDKACRQIAEDDELWNMVVDYVQVPDAPIEKLAPILKTIPPFVPNAFGGKCIYRGEPHYSGAYDEKWHYRGTPTWTGSHREVLSWSSNWDTAFYFAEGRGFVWQSVGKIQGVQLSDIVTWRMRARPGESHYSGMQGEWFVLSGNLKAKEAVRDRKTAAEGYIEEGQWAGEGDAASGILPVCPSKGTVCLAWRSNAVHQGDCWGTIGGAVKSGMSPEQSAKNELGEETGYRGGINLIPAHVFTDGGFKYHNFIGVVGAEFAYNPGDAHEWETDALEWMPLEEVLEKMETEPGSFHPGLVELLKNDNAKLHSLMGKPKIAAGWVRGLWITADGKELPLEYNEDHGRAATRLGLAPKSDYTSAVAYALETGAVRVSFYNKEVSIEVYDLGAGNTRQLVKDHLITHPSEYKIFIDSVAIGETESFDGSQECVDWLENSGMSMTSAAKEPKFGYHGTDRANLDDILKNGLKSDMSESHVEWGKAIYIACDEYTARNYAGMWGVADKDWVVLRIDLSKLNKDRLRPDDYELPDMWQEVPASIRNECGDNWALCPWQVSMRYVCQAAYLGDIPPAAIQTIKQTVFASQPLDAWFAGSKVVDAEGKPLVCYHGTNEQFSRVNMGKGAQGVFWVTSDRSKIERGESGASGAKHILGMYVNIKNPAGWAEYEKYSLGELKRDYDGVILPEKDGTFDAIVFKPNQVRMVKPKTAASEDTIYSHVEGQDIVASALLSEYAAHLNDKAYRQQWTLVPAGRLKKIWNDYAKLGFVRDEAGINKIADIIITNIHKIEVNNILTGHTQNNPLDYAESITDERPPENYFDINESFFDDEHESWRISDYAANALSNEALNLQEAKTAEDKLQIIDRILNIVHQRSDIAGWFVEGGTSTLNGIAGKTAAANQYLYHVTFSGYLDGIQEHGLVPNAEPGITGGGEKGKVFVTEASEVSFWLSRAEDWAYHRSDNPAEGLVPVVLRFPRQEAQNLVKDEFEGHQAAYTADLVPSDSMEMWNGKAWGGLWLDDTVPVADEEGYLLNDPMQKPKLAALTPENRDEIEELTGGYIIDEAEIGDYELILMGTELIPDFFQIGIQRHGFNMADKSQHMETQPLTEMPADGRKTVNGIKQVIDGWLDTYGKLHAVSQSPDKTNKYMKVLRLLGYNVGAEPLIYEGREVMKEVPYIQKAASAGTDIVADDQSDFDESRGILASLGYESIRSSSGAEEFWDQKTGHAIGLWLDKTADDSHLRTSVEAAGGTYHGKNSAGLVEITLPRSMTNDLNIQERFKDFVSVTMPEAGVTPDSVKAAMERKVNEMLAGKTGGWDMRYVPTGPYAKDEEFTIFSDGGWIVNGEYYARQNETHGNLALRLGFKSETDALTKGAVRIVPDYGAKSGVYIEVTRLNSTVKREISEFLFADPVKIDFIIVEWKGGYEEFNSVPEVTDWLENTGKVAASTADVNVDAIVAELMSVIPDVSERPRVVIVDNLSPKAMGVCHINGTTSKLNVWITVEKACTLAEDLFRRVLAHEICHYATYMDYMKRVAERKESDKALFDRTQVFNDSHMGPWIYFAQKFNGKYGSDFVDAHSDFRSEWFIQLHHQLHGDKSSYAPKGDWVLGSKVGHWLLKSSTRDRLAEFLDERKTFTGTVGSMGRKGYICMENLKQNGSEVADHVWIAGGGWSAGLSLGDNVQFDATVGMYKKMEYQGRSFTKKLVRKGEDIDFSLEKPSRVTKTADSPQLDSRRYTEYPEGSNGWANQPDRRGGGFGLSLPSIEKLVEEGGEAVDGTYDLGVTRTGKLAEYKNRPSNDPERWERFTEMWLDTYKAQAKKVDTFKEYGVYAFQSTEEGYWNFWVVDKDDRVVGSAFGGPHTKYEDKIEGAIEVEPNHRRQGIGSVLYSAAEKLLGKKIAPSLPHSNDAQNFWDNPKRTFGSTRVGKLFKKANRIGPVFHGTPNMFEEFAPQEVANRTHGLFGISYTVKTHAYFFTPDSQVAWNWAENRTKQHGDKRYVKQCYITIDNPLDFRDASWIDADVSQPDLPFDGGKTRYTLLEELRDNLLPDFPWQNYGIDAGRLRVDEQGQEWKLLDDKKFVDAIRHLGYDGVVCDEGEGEFGGISYAVFDSGQIQVVKTNTAHLAATQSELVQVQRVMRELFPILGEELPEPELKIVNQQRSNWWGQDTWRIAINNNQLSWGANTRIDVQKSIVGDENTLRRVLAHELCHHADSLVNGIKELQRYEGMGTVGYKMFVRNQKGTGHGPSWKLYADKYNAKYGGDFVTEHSDESYVQDKSPVKPYWIALCKFPSGKLYFAVATRIGGKGVSRWLWNKSKSPDPNVRMTQTTDPVFLNGSMIGDKWTIPQDDDKKAKLQELWNSAPTELPPADPKFIAERQEEADLVAKWRERDKAKTIDQPPSASGLNLQSSLFKDAAGHLSAGWIMTNGKFVPCGGEQHWQAAVRYGLVDVDYSDVDEDGEFEGTDVVSEAVRAGNIRVQGSTNPDFTVMNDTPETRKLIANTIRKYKATIIHCSIEFFNPQNYIDKLTPDEAIRWMVTGEEPVKTDVRKWRESSKTAGLKGKLEFHQEGSSLWIDMFELKPEDRGKGGGRTAWTEFEASIPETIKLLRLVAGDTGDGNSAGFWEKMGFDYTYEANENGDEDEESDIYMWKGINGNPTPEQLTPEADIEKFSAKRGVWYHGTSIKNLRSIIAEGLVPEGKKKNWDSDPNAGIHTPSREAYGGIYVTQNLMTATGSVRDDNGQTGTGRKLVVVAELQPQTFFLDEDSIVSSLGAPIQHISDSQYHVTMVYIAATQPGVSASWQTNAAEFKKNYIKHAMEMFDYKFKEQEKEMHADLRARLEQLVTDTWLPALGRLAAHFAKGMKDYDVRKSYTEVFNGKWDETPPKDTLFPSVAQGEADFRKHAEQITRTMRPLAYEQKGYRATARVTTPIGYSGSNHIVAVVEIRDGRQYVYKNAEGKTVVRMVVHYGKLPEDFWNQWNEKFGYAVEMGEQTKAASAKEAVNENLLTEAGRNWRNGGFIMPDGSVEYCKNVHDEHNLLAQRLGLAESSSVFYDPVKLVRQALDKGAIRFNVWGSWRVANKTVPSTNFQVGTLDSGSKAKMRDYILEHPTEGVIIEWTRNGGVGNVEFTSVEETVDWLESDSLRHQSSKVAEWVDVERHSEPEHTEGFFYGPAGTGYADYGPVKTNAQIDDDFIYHGTSTYDLLHETGHWDDPIPKDIRQNVLRVVKEIKEAFPEDTYIQGLTDDPQTIAEAADYQGFGGEDFYFEMLQRTAADILQKQGYKGAFWTEEDDLSPEQYQIWDRSAIRKMADMKLASPLLILAVDYMEMFKSFLKSITYTNQTGAWEAMAKKEVAWAKEHLEKADRITWYLRWVRLDLIKQAEDVKVVPAGSFDNARKEYAQKSGKPTSDLTAIWVELAPLKRKLLHYLALEDVNIQSKRFQFQTPEELLREFGELEDAMLAKADESKRMLEPQEGDEIFIKFDNGWAWWLLSRGYCPAEAKAMGHCGNQGQVTGDRIISLREPRKKGDKAYWEPNLTFIYDQKSKQLGEMKGRGNEKPAARYHPYIISLLKDPRIEGITGGGYMPSHNFSVSDLSEAEQNEIYETKPALMPLKLYLTRTGVLHLNRITPGAKLDAIAQKKICALLGSKEDNWVSDGLILATYRDWGELVDDWGDDTAKWAKKQDEGNDYSDSSSTEGVSKSDMIDLLDDVKPETVHNIGLTLEQTYPDELKDFIEKEGGTDEFTWEPNVVGDVKDFLGYLENDAGVNTDVYGTLDTAYRYGLESGTSNEVNKYLTTAVENATDEDENTFVRFDASGGNKFAWEGKVHVVLQTSRAAEVAINVEEDEGGNNDYYDNEPLREMNFAVKMKDPYNGFGGYDKSASIDHINDSFRSPPKPLSQYREYEDDAESLESEGVSD